MPGTARKAVCCAHEQAGPGLRSRGSGSRLERRRWEWAVVGAVTLGDRAMDGSGQGPHVRGCWDRRLGGEQGTSGRKQGSGH